MRKIRKTLWIALVISLSLWGMAKAYLLYSNKMFPAEEIAEWFEPVKSKYKIRINYQIGGDFFSPIENPPIPAGPGRHSKVTPIRHRVLAKYPNILLAALEKYPVHVIKEHLNAIYFAGDIDEDGFHYGGTYDPFRKIVYIVDDGITDPKSAMSTFHHEFSSLLIRSHSFFVNPWADNNPKNFEYLFSKMGESTAVYMSTSLVGTEADWEKGFMDSYGQTNFENDFNEYSAMIFTYPDKFKKIMAQYPRVRGKFLVWLEFYQKIDPIFTEEYLFGKSISNKKQMDE